MKIDGKINLKIVFIVIIAVLIVGILLGLFLLLVKNNLKLEIEKNEEQIDVGSKYVVQDARASTLFDKDAKTEIEGNVDTSKVGTYKITYRLKSMFFTIEKNKFVKVVDTVKPEIVLNGKAELTIYQGDTYNDEGCSAKDNYDGDITNNVKVDNSNFDNNKIGDYEISYSIEDSSQNKNTIKRTIHVIAKPEPVSQPEQSIPKSYSQVGNKIIYLTFDDGPSSYTSSFLDLLKKYNAKATFFVTGKGSDDLIKRAYNEGHAIGLHTWSHDYSIYKSVETYYSDLNKIDNRVYNLTGVHSKIIRFPGGASNTVSRNYCQGIMTKLTKDVEQKGYEYWDWNISSGDAGGAIDPNTIFHNVVDHIGPSKTNVVLMHDIHEYTLKSLEPILKWGIENGYSFRSISKDIKPMHHKVAN